MTANMYRVGDYVYFETSSTSPFQIRRIEELNKTASGNVEAKVMCFYRRRDLPNQLIQLADKHQCALDESNGGSPRSPDSNGGSMNCDSSSSLLNPKQRHQMKHRELFLSRQVETLPATHIRGKCSVTLFNETESLGSYLNKDDMFFYCLVFDPTQKTLLADKGEIRVGSRYQSDITPLLRENESDGRDLNELETLVWTPGHQLSDRQIDQFLVVSRSVGTFARALDCSSSVKQPSLHMSAAAASRDITLFHAMDTLHRHDYDLSGALCSLVPSSGPVLCRDEMEEWSASEANLFEEALDKYGKDFTDIRQDFLPWKTLKNIIEYYYMWKTTDRYVQQKRVKAVEAESKLKQVYIPNYNKPNPAALNNNKGMVNGSSNGSSDPAAVSLGGKSCESCNVTVSSQWYAWGPSHMQCRLCHNCWQYWKKYGGLKIPTRFGESELFDMNSTQGIVAGNNNPLMGGMGANQHQQLLQQQGMMNPQQQQQQQNKNSMKNRSSSLVGGGGGSGSDLEDDYLIRMGGGALGAGGGVVGGGGLGSQHRPHKCNIGGCGKEFKLKAHLGRHYATAHGILVRSGSPRPIMKTRTAFYLFTTPLTRISRRLSRHIMRPRHAARAPFFAINIQSVKQDSAVKMLGKAQAELKQLLLYRKRNRGSVTAIANRLGKPSSVTPQWLILTDKDSMPKPEKVAFPKPPKAADGSLLYERIPNKPEADKIPLNNMSPSLKRRAYDEMNGIDSAALNAGGPPLKRLAKDPQSSSTQLPVLGQASSIAISNLSVMSNSGHGGGGGGAPSIRPPSTASGLLDPYNMQQQQLHPHSSHHHHQQSMLLGGAGAGLGSSNSGAALNPNLALIQQQQQLSAGLMVGASSSVAAAASSNLSSLNPSLSQHQSSSSSSASSSSAAHHQQHHGLLHHHHHHLQQQQQQQPQQQIQPQQNPAAPPPSQHHHSHHHHHHQQVLPRHISQINGKPKIAHMTRTGSGRKQVISWMDAPDDVYFRATDASKRIRRQVPLIELRRAARKPWRPLKSKFDEHSVVVLD